MQSGSALLILSRENDAFFPAVAFRAELEVVLDKMDAATGVLVLTGGGVLASLEFDDVEQDEWFHVWSYASLSEMRAALDGTWTILISGSIPSASTFTLDAGALEESNFFASPSITNPLDAAVEVPPSVVTSWVPPASGPYPAYVLDVWIDYGYPGGPGSYPGPSEFLEVSATAWDPKGDLDLGLARLSVEYAVAAPGTVVGPMVVDSGAMVWMPHGFEPPGYPRNAPLVALSGRTRIGFSVGACAPAADLDCDGAVAGSDLGLLLANWGGAGTGDIDSSGVVDGADLGQLLGSWSE